MEGTDLTLSRVIGAPPVMPWREFANWIRMENEHDKVRGWIRNER